MLDNLSQSEKVVGALLLLFLFAGALESAPWLIFMLLIFGAIYAFNQRNNQQEDTRSYERRTPTYNRQPRRYADADYDEDTTDPDVRRYERPANVEKVHSHAIRAVRRAGMNPDNVPVLPVDIGVLTFRADEKPVIHRSWPVGDDIDYLQPFVQLRVPVEANGNVRFEIIDSGGETVFLREDTHQLKRGRNLIVPSSRLPVHDQQDSSGRWELRVSADNVLLARHHFEWEVGESASPLNQHIAEDGEISSELRAVLAENRLERMSLDDLLGEQGVIHDDEEPRRHIRR
jgi:hypothetical protein